MAVQVLSAADGRLGVMRGLAAIGVAAFVAASPAPSAAQSGIEGLAGFESGLAPGFESPEFETEPRIREPLQPFGVEPDGDFLDTDTNTPINEFAGQTRRYDPGLIGGLLGSAKNRLLGRD